MSKNYIDQFERDGTDFVVILLAGSSDKGFSFVKSEILQNRHTLEATGYFSSIDNQYKIINSCLRLLGRSQFDFTSFEELEELLKNYLEKKGCSEPMNLAGISTQPGNLKRRRRKNLFSLAEALKKLNNS